MSDHEDLSTEATRSDGTSLAERVSACERFVDEAIERDMGATWLADSLKGIGLKAVEAIDYVEDYAQRMEIRRSKARQPDSPPGEPQARTTERDEEQRARDQAVDEAAWASLLSKLGSSAQELPSTSQSNVLDKMLEFLGQETSDPSSLSKSVLAVAPHLAEDEDSVFEDPHLSETHKCRIAYASQKPFENLVIKAQGRKVLEPIANSIWKLVILDKYVDFEKLYVTLDPGYNPNDEAKDLNEKFTLLEKNTVGSRRPVLTEAEWMRLFDVWASGVLHFYPHRRSELVSYREIIVDMFRASASPYPAIRYDRDSRERYSRQPCRLDSSKSALPFPLLSQLLSGSATSPSSMPLTDKKRSGGGQEGPRKKRAETICQNWNLGACDGDPCYYGRRHNLCCECNEPHRAKDRSDCLAALNRRRQQQKAAAAARSSRT
jgi:hypothetical protein